MQEWGNLTGTAAALAWAFYSVRKSNEELLQERGLRLDEQKEHTTQVQALEERFNRESQTRDERYTNDLAQQQSWRMEEQKAYVARLEAMQREFATRLEQVYASKQEVHREMLDLYRSFVPSGKVQRPGGAK